MVDTPITRRDESPDLDWSVYLARGQALTIEWASEGYLRLLGEPHESRGVIGLPLFEVSPLATTRAAVLQGVLTTGIQQGGIDRAFSVEDGSIDFEWRAYRPLPDHVLVVIYRTTPSLNRTIAEQFERVAWARADSAMLLETQRQAAIALKHYEERAASLLRASQEDAASAIRIIGMEDAENAPPELRETLQRVLVEAAEELAGLQEEAARALRESQQATAALLVEATAKEIEATQDIMSD